MPAPTRLHLGRSALLVVVVGASVIWWHTWPLLPFKLLAVMGHETGHALATLLVGGSIRNVTLAMNESGACLSSIPDGFFAKVLVYSAGYVGSAIVSVVLLGLTFRANAGRWMLALASAWLALMGLLYARDAFTFGFCAVFALLFAGAAKWLPRELVEGLNLFIAAFTALYAVLDLRDDLWDSAVRAQSDAQLLANVTIVPAVVWATVWTMVSLVVIAWGGWLSLQARPTAVAKPS